MTRRLQFVCGARLSLEETLGKARIVGPAFASYNYKNVLLVCDYILIHEQVLSTRILNYKVYKLIDNDKSKSNILLFFSKRHPYQGMINNFRCFAGAKSCKMKTKRLLMSWCHFFSLSTGQRISLLICGK